MPAPEGNKFWEARSRHGRNPKYTSAQMLEEGCLDYFEWVVDNPLKEEKVFAFQGEVGEKGRVEVNKMRPMTIQGLCTFLGISHDTWLNYKQREDFIGVINWVEQIIYDQKFAGAAAGILNPNIIARDLGLVEKSEVEVKTKLKLRDFSGSGD